MNSIYDRFIDALGRGTAWLSLLMAAVTLVVVVLRYVFNIGAIPLQELVVYMHAVLFMFGLAYTFKEDGHVRIDLIYSRFGPKRRAITNLIGHLIFFLPTAAVIGVLSIDYVIASWRVLEGSQEITGLPAVYLLKTLIPLTAFLLFLQAIAETIRSIAQLRIS